MSTRSAGPGDASRAVQRRLRQRVVQLGNTNANSADDGRRDSSLTCGARAGLRAGAVRVSRRIRCETPPSPPTPDVSLVLSVSIALVAAWPSPPAPLPLMWARGANPRPHQRERVRAKRAGEGAVAVPREGMQLEKTGETSAPTPSRRESGLLPSPTGRGTEGQGSTRANKCRSNADE